MTRKDKATTPSEKLAHERAVERRRERRRT
jgi:hypothetical protein